MNLTTKVKAHIVAEFKSGVSMLECDRRYLQKPGTTERLVREAIKAQDYETESRLADVRNFG